MTPVPGAGVAHLVLEVPRDLVDLLKAKLTPGVILIAMGHVRTINEDVERAMFGQPSVQASETNFLSVHKKNLAPKSRCPVSLTHRVKVSSCCARFSDDEQNFFTSVLRAEQGAVVVGGRIVCALLSKAVESSDTRSRYLAVPRE